MKDLGLYAEAAEHEKEMEKVQADIDKSYQPEEDDQDQRTQQKYDKALEDYSKLEKLRDEVVKKMLDTFHIFDDILASSLIPLRGLHCEV